MVWRLFVTYSYFKRLGWRVAGTHLSHLHRPISHDKVELRFVA